MCGDRHLEIGECSQRLQRALSAERPSQIPRTPLAWRRCEGFEGDPRQAAVSVFVVIPVQRGIERKVLQNLKKNGAKSR
jgi:hypothetical protein